MCAAANASFERDVDAFLEIAKREGLHIKHVLETHVHADFVSGSRELKDRLGDDVTINANRLLVAVACAECLTAS